MILYIFHQGRTANVEYANLDGMLKYRQDSKSIDNRIRYTVHMDKGFIAWTHGVYDPGGNSINPTGKLGQNLIKLANDWINNPETAWSKKGYWHAHFYRSKFPSFTKPGPPPPKQKMRVGRKLAIATAIIIFAIVLLVQLCQGV